VYKSNTLISIGEIAFFGYNSKLPDMKKNFLLSFMIFVLFLSACEEGQKEAQPEAESVQQPVVLKLNSVFDLYSNATNIPGGEKKSAPDIPEFQDLIYEIRLSRNYDINSWETFARFYFTYEGLQSVSPFVLNLEANTKYSMGLKGLYMLDDQDRQKVQDAGLATEEIQVTNSVKEDAPADTTVVIHERFQDLSNFRFGTHMLNQLFALSVYEFMPNPDDTIRLSNREDELQGPKLFDIQVDSSNNNDLAGHIVFEMVEYGYSGDTLSFDIDKQPEGLLISEDEVESVELLYRAPSGVHTPLIRKETDLGGYGLLYLLMNVTVPEVVTDENGEFVAVKAPGMQVWNIDLGGDLFDKDTIRFGK
jgi:hypothetical protein